MPRRPKTPEQIEYEQRYRQMHLDLMKLFRTTPENQLTDEDLLAVALSYSMRKCDYRQAAKDLLNSYGSLKNLLNACTDELLNEGPLRLNTVLMLKGIPALCQHAEIEQIPKRLRINKPQNAEVYLKPHFIGYNYEKAYLLLLNDYYYPKKLILIGEGSGSRVYIDPQKITRDTVVNRCNKIVLAHSHIGQNPNPSLDDKLTTLEVARLLSGLGIQVLDHLIFAENICYYLSNDEEMDRSILAFSKREPKTIREKLQYPKK